MTMGGAFRLLGSEGDRLENQYGGKASSYEKITSSTYNSADGGNVKNHAFRNSDTEQIIEPKTVIEPSEKPL